MELIENWQLKVREYIGTWTNWPPFADDVSEKSSYENVSFSDLNFLRFQVTVSSYQFCQWLAVERAGS